MCGTDHQSPKINVDLMNYLEFGFQAFELFSAVGLPRFPFHACTSRPTSCKPFGNTNSFVYRLVKPIQASIAPSATTVITDHSERRTTWEEAQEPFLQPSSLLKLPKTNDDRKFLSVDRTKDKRTKETWWFRPSEADMSARRLVFNLSFP